MKIGLLLDLAECTNAATVARVAQQAESVGFDSLWMFEDEPFPARTAHMRTAYDGSLPAADARVHNAMQALAIAGDQTDRIDSHQLAEHPLLRPLAVRAERASIETHAPGRVAVCLGRYGRHEFRVVASLLSRSDSPASEFVSALRTLRDGSGFHGEYFFIPRSRNTAPVSVPAAHPLYLTAFAPAAVQRPVVLLRGAEPTASATHSALDSLRELRRDGNFGVVVRASIVSSIEPLPAGRALFHGSIEQCNRTSSLPTRLARPDRARPLHDSPGHSLDELLSRISRVIALVPVESRVSESVAAAA